ncbi:MAG: FMN-binding negative transcriptional regulator [Microvirga sp.]|jgi:transcriptional regulator|uniref:FMN-binding negative transcriptional regulator n=1 Tax=Microvirga tunisiensis TaxID=2108360 RepID=A0A5N7MMR5_9HYPH|nr:FMN-binding negative transcriptional regulator [Microvirga tunisiensis]MPR10124.1 FMN-binding negative transcriptional regulator [Microvirga tunisiensis]MPR28331.1 FMN-binding negative transcriptional regulator [Microvirga tunisiensis]
MYQPPHFREDDLAVQHALIKAHPLGLLVTFGSDGLEANPIPFVLEASASSLGTLKAHLSRANPQWRNFDPAQEALVVFQGPETYITPSWYAAKREHGKVVPTWNYAIVQARGRLTIRDDPDWLRQQITAMTEMQEGPRPEPWNVSDAPAPFVAAQLKGIVGIEIEITRIEGKWKVSQNRPEADRLGVSAGLRLSQDDASHQMAELVDARGALPRE